MNVLVTGAAGFLGSHLCDRLIADGHRVIGLDNLSTGRAGNLAHLADEPRFSLLHADVAGLLELPGESPKLDAIAHLASPASPVDFGPLAIPIMRANGEGTWRLLELARRRDARFLLASTSEVYGDPRVHPQPEDYVGHVNPIGERAVYDESKRYAEAMAAAYRRRHGVDARIVRIFNTYGPRMRPDDGRVLPAFIRAGLAGNPLPVQGDGCQTRSFCYVSDTVEGICRALGVAAEGDSPLFQEELKRGTVPINIGNPDEVTIRELADEVIALTGGRSRINFLPLPPDDPRRRCPDIARARRLLGWAPKVNRAEGLAMTVDWFGGVPH